MIYKNFLKNCIIIQENGAKNVKIDLSLDKWDVSNVIDMRNMFQRAFFNQPLDDWDVSNVRYMKDMFNDSKLENTHNLPDWYNE